MTRDALRERCETFIKAMIADDNPVLWERYHHCEGEVEHLLAFAAAERADEAEACMGLVDIHDKADAVLALQARAAAWRKES